MFGCLHNGDVLQKVLFACVHGGIGIFRIDFCWDYVEAKCSSPRRAHSQVFTKPCFCEYLSLGNGPSSSFYRLPGGTFGRSFPAPNIGMTNL